LSAVRAYERRTLNINVARRIEWRDPDCVGHG
jgi:hypothetical protein